MADQNNDPEFVQNEFAQNQYSDEHSPGRQVNTENGAVNPYAAVEAQQSFGAEDPTIRLPGEASMVRQVMVVSILTIVAAGLELLMAALMVSMPILFMTISQDSAQSQAERDMLGYMGMGYGIVGGLVLAVALLRIVAAIQFMRFKAKNLFLVSLCVGLVPALTCYCAPTSIGIFVYGLVVVLNSGVERACRMRANGLSPAEIRQRFSH